MVKQYILILMEIGLTNKFDLFNSICKDRKIPELPRNKFMDLEFDLQMILNSNEYVCLYTAYLDRKNIKLKIMSNNTSGTTIVTGKCGSCGGGLVR